MRNRISSRLAICLCMILWPGPGSQTSAAPRPAPELPPLLPNAPVDEDISFEKNLELLHVQMKIRVLKKLRELNFFVPKTLPLRYFSEQQELCSDLGIASGKDLDTVSDWTAEVERTRDAEVSLMQKAAEDYGRKVLDFLTEGAKDPNAKQEKDGDRDKSFWVAYREYQLKMAEWNKKDKKRAVEMAQYIKRLSETIASRPGPRKFNDDWKTTMDQIYRGALKDRNDLIAAMDAIEKERLYYVGCLRTMKEIQDKLKLIDSLTDEKSFWESSAEKARDRAIEYLQEKYGNDNDQIKSDIKWSAEKIYSAVKAGWDTWRACSDLDKDPVLKENPTALAGCKRMAAFTAIYDTISDTSKDLTILAPLRPLFKVLDYYSKAMGLITPFARAMQKFADQVDQDCRGFRRLDRFGDLMDQGFGPFWDTSLSKVYHLPIATGHDRFDGPNLDYYMVAPKDKTLAGYFHWGQKEHDRLAEALACERMINAPQEAASGVFNKFRDTNLLSPTAAEGYLNEVKTKARNSPFQDDARAPDVRALADGQPVNLNGKEQTADSLARRFDTNLDIMAEEMTVRTAVAQFQPSCLKDWENFKALVRDQKVPLPPQQLLNLFGFYESNGAHAEHVTNYLRRVANQRKWRRLGTVRVGIPLVTSLSETRGVYLGRDVEIRAYVIVSDLAPQREVDAELSWILPSWAGPTRKQTVKLRNGPDWFKTTLSLPHDVPREPFEVKVMIRLPWGEGEQAALEKPGMVSSLLSPQSIAPKEPDGNTNTESYREFKSSGAFNIIENAGITLVPIPAGKFKMGSPDSEAGRGDDEQEHSVTITHSFLMGATPVTQSQWVEVMGPEHLTYIGGDIPVEASFDDAVAFCKKLSQREGKTFRLPTEAEWEYACRAGAAGTYGGTGNLDNMGWYEHNSGGKVHPVAGKKPNSWNLYDMHGNVSQWSSDWYAPYSPEAATNPSGPDTGSRHVLRGGTWNSFAVDCRSASRNAVPASDPGIRAGFRVCVGDVGHVLRDIAMPRPAEPTVVWKKGPLGTSIADWLHVSRWMTVRRIASFNPEEVGEMDSVKMSGDGSKIAYACHAGVFVINSDGTGKIGPLTKRWVTGLDISYDGHLVVWYADQTDAGLQVADLTTNTIRQLLPRFGNLGRPLRLTKSGRYLFVAPGNVNSDLFKIPTDGSDKHPVPFLTIGRLREMLGLPKNEAEQISWWGTFDISGNASKMVIVLGNDAYALEGNLSRFTRLTHVDRANKEGNVDRAFISGDGSRIACRIPYATEHQPELMIMDWSGHLLNSFKDPYLRPDAGGTDELKFTADGNYLFGFPHPGWGVRIFTADPQQPRYRVTELSPEHGPFESWPYMGAASIPADGRCCCLATGTRHSTLSIIEFNGKPLATMPLLHHVNLSDRSVPVNDRLDLTITASVDGAHLKLVSAQLVIPHGRMPRDYVGPVNLNDEGKDGDAVAHDGIYTGHLTAKADRIDDGPIGIRFYAMDDAGNTMILDVEGLRAGPPPRQGN